MSSAIDEAHLARQREWSDRTFGPGRRTRGLIDHITKEFAEIAADPGDLKEWVDVVILALDGAGRTGATPAEIIEAIRAKQARNEARTWPDWKDFGDDVAIEHDRTSEPEPAITEARLREILAANPYFGDWAEWAPIAYNKIPTFARQAMQHLYGLHNEAEIPYAYCVLCTLFRLPMVDEPEPTCEPGRYATSPNGGVNYVCQEDGALVAFFGGRELHDKWHSEVGDHLARFDRAGQQIRLEAGEVRHDR